MAEKTVKIDRTIAIVSYITLIGFIIALLLNSKKLEEEKSFNAFHLRQSLGLLITGFLAALAIGIVSSILLSISSHFSLITSLMNPIVSIGILVLAVMGIINAANGQKKELPLIGELIEKKLKRIFE